MIKLNFFFQVFGRVEKFHSALGEVQARNKSAELLNRGIAVQHE